MAAASKPLISVIVPTYNRPMALSECMEALLRQQYDSLEVIIVNDHGENVDFIVQLYPELSIRVINMESNVGHVEARNRGLLEAKGEFILLCDDDDLLLPGHIRRLLKHARHTDVVHTDVEIVEYREEAKRRVPVSRRLFAYSGTYEQMRRFSTFVSSGCMYRRDLHEEIGLFDKHVHNYWDWDFYLRAMERCRVKRIPVASVLYAFSDGGNHASGISRKRQDYLERLSLKHGLGDLPQKNFFLLLEEEEMLERRSISRIVWDGMPIGSRLDGQTSQSDSQGLL